jgi:arsenite/tail-anchored protein-transporting ATPase
LSASFPTALDAPVVLVVGKGGVGKTTTAAALAVACADAGVRTHLISTDPAHNLADVFGLEPGGGAPRPAGCVAGLALEEFDATAYMGGWVDASRGAIAQLVEAGTYLDEADVRPFLELTLPGIDEVAAALRLAELAGGEARIIVDTAPTGHTLRLLDTADVVASWVGAFRAMGEKAAVVASHIARRSVRLEAETILDDLERRVAAFEERVLGAAAAVLVTAAGAVVAAETRRLHAALDRRGVRTALVVRTGAAGGSMGDAPEHRGVAPLLVLPRGAAGTGCDALRAVLVAAARPAADRRPPSHVAADDGAAGHTHPAAGGAAVLARLERLELAFFAGKGGVGKTTCAAAAALAASEHREVALYGADPAGSLADVLAVPIAPEGTAVGARLFVRELDAAVGFRLLREQHRERVEEVFARFGLEHAAALDRRVMESFWELAPPGLDEVYALLEILEAERPGRLLVIDAAPTGHFLRLIELPGPALQWVHAFMRVLIRYRAAAGLDDVAADVLAFAKRLKLLRDRLTDPARTGAFLVTGGAALVRAESDRLRAALDRAGVPLAAVIHNRTPASGIRSEGRSRSDSPLQLQAPQLSEPPAGERALRGFFSSWGMPR